MWYIALIDLRILKNPCIPWIKPIWSWCMIFLIYCWILSNLSIMREINPEYSLKGLMLKLKLQYFGPSDVNSRFTGKFPDWERLKAEGEEGIRGWDNWMASLMQWTCTWANFGRWWETESPGVLHHGVHGVTKTQTQQGNWKETAEDLFKKIGDKKGTVHTKNGMIKNRKDSKNLTEAEEIKYRWQEYTEEVY